MFLANAWVGPLEARAQPTNPRSEWRTGVEMDARPGLVAAWESSIGPWRASAALAVGPGEDPVRLRATPHARVARALWGPFQLAGGLGLEWARLGRGWNRDESEILWEVAAGWRTAGSLLLEAAVRWTDFHRPRRTGLIRLTAPLSVARSRPRASTAPPHGRPVPRDLGVPGSMVADGHLSFAIPTLEREGGGLSLMASNPRGDPDPRTPDQVPNVDRLAMASEAWAGGERWRAWARWRSDLHTDPSIAERTRQVAEGLSFPTSVSFSGGGAWRPRQSQGLEISLRHAPQLLLWMPHLASERTAEATAAGGVFEHGGAALELEGGGMRGIEGRTVDPLTHFRGAIVGPPMGRLRMGLEHQRVTAAGDADQRTRAIARLDGPVRLDLAAGSDVTMEVSGSHEGEGWSASGRAWYRSRPEPLHLDALLARGWSAETDRAPHLEPGSSGGVHVGVGRGPVALEARSLVREPVWAPTTVSRAEGGWVEMTWADTLSFVDLRGQARIASWGPPTAWWREAPSLSGRVGIGGALGPARIRGWADFRTEVHSARSGLSAPAGIELGLGTDLPLPDLGSSRGITARMELADVLDQGVPLRPGAPRRGRRLTAVLTWDLTGPP